MAFTFEYPLPVSGPMTSRDMRFIMDRMVAFFVPVTVITGWTLSDGTNAFTTGTVNAWWRKVDNAAVEVIIGGTFTTGGTVTGSGLRVSNSAWGFTINTSGTVYGFGCGSMCTQAGADPRGIITVTVPTTTAIQFARSNGAAWGASTAYVFNARVIVPITP